MKQLTTSQFNKLPKGERAVLIVKDVIKQLNSKNIITSHTYIGNLRFEGSHIDENHELDASTCIRKGKITCTGCARASLFISAVKFKNKLTLGELYSANFSYDHGDSTKYLSKEFSKYQQALIETTYEQGFHSTSNRFGDISDKDFEKCKSFFDSKSYLWDTDNDLSKDNYILIAICKNIIKNKGVFKP